ELLIKIRTILDRASDLRLLKMKSDVLEEEARQYRDDLRRSHAEMQHYLERIGSLLRHVEEASRLQDLQEVLSGLIQSCVRDLGISRVCLLKREGNDDPDGPAVFIPQAGHGLDDHALRGLRLGAEGFLCQTLALEGRTMTVDEFSGYPSTSEDLQALAALGLSHLTPVQRGSGELAAILAGGDKTGGEGLDRFDLHLLEILARSAGMALASAEVFAGARESFMCTTGRLVAGVEARYPELAGHSDRVTELALRLAAALGLTEEERTTLCHVARLHDLGSLDQYEHLYAESRLFSDEERTRIRRLAAEGVRRQLERAHMARVAEGVCHLNERWDGAGMPDGIAGEAIPLSSRMVAIANAFDALGHPRPHRPAYTAEEALLIIRDRAGRQFDPALVAAFSRMVEEEREAVQSLMMPMTRGPEERSK
ncbi:MAG: HD domain-containing phosphohydrolase, partial [Candidatus Eisenbacteria bacterium]